MCARLIEIRCDNIFGNCQFLEWNAAIIPDIAKRFAVKEFINTFDGFPEQSMLTNEYAWPMSPEAPRALRSESSSTTPELDAQNREKQGSWKRSAQWDAGEQGIIKKHCNLHERTAKTAARVRSASWDSNLDSQCAVTAKAPGMYSYIFY